MKASEDSTGKEREARERVASLFAEFGEKLWNSALKMCRNPADAEDLTMRTFEQALRKYSLFDDSRPPFPWLCGILVNLYRMDLRGKARNALEFTAKLPEPEDAAPLPPEIVASEADAHAVHEALARLPDRHRALVVLRYFDDLSVPEIAEQLGMPEGSVKRLLHEARALLRADLSRTISRGDA